MKLSPTPIAGLMTVTTTRHNDDRGYFTRVFCAPSLHQQGQAFTAVQVNMSCSARRATLRGLHYQGAGAPEAKLFRCMRGSLFDACVDMRAGSPTFLQSFSITLNSDNDLGLLISPGIAHGFMTLADDTQALYMTSAVYSPADECAVRYNDPRLDIAWPLIPEVISERDSAIPDLPADFTGVLL